MDRILVRPNGPLTGEVTISGAKNSALLLMAATLLAPGEHVLTNVPRITDVATMTELLGAIGVESERDATTVVLRSPASLLPEAPYELVARMRASIGVLGPLLARCGEARVAVPGGDDFGSRPIDMHLSGLEALGAKFELEHGYVRGWADGLRGAPVTLEFPSVGATENILMAAVLAKGSTVIENAAREPEISDLADLLNAMGAHIEGAGTSTIEVEGVETLHATKHETIPDRVEAATFLAAVAVTGGDVLLRNARADDMEMYLRKLADMGMTVTPTLEGVWSRGPERLRSVDVSTLPYPGVATDYKPLFTVMLAVADGVGIVTENLFAGRFRYVDELIRMGADVRTDAHHAVVRGRTRLSGAPVRAPDIRAGAALVVAGLVAEGETEVSGVEHIDRGYEDFVGKLAALGAHIERIST
ncbi:MAG TPA: UDP-N-acetylglucosamine 1-carboxyvinyltransferase [Acidimicrobiales bacterium]|nr:UDP-N-acetylglucosamine 1-carboxyvinyltransferase [Acidimicrobiales bacterium]